ncbi:hypothetical protein [Empedobacter brevis]|uniref:hypothetical protein n=1 Tax=Empedobacter brevis TaxID=247 RepID=UPI0039B10107
MFELLFALLGFFFPNQNTNTISQDNHASVYKLSADNSIEGETNGETGNTPPKK